MKKKKAEAPENHERWLVSYADFMTLLFALFVVLYSFAMAKQSEVRVIIQGFIQSLGKIGLISPPAGSPIMQGGTGILEPESRSTVSSENKPSVMESDHAPASNPMNETIGQSAKPDDTNSWPHPSPESNGWVQETKKQLQEQLKAQIETSQLEVEQLGNHLIIRIGEKALFPADSAFLQPQFIPLVQKIGTVLATIPGQIQVTGHTDQTPPPKELYQSNWELSVLRAAAIVHVLITNRDLDATRIVAEGKADTQPRFANDTDEHRQGNRRVEITLSQGNPSEEKMTILK
ncbi:chemotaxis protein MotB [Aeromonas sp. RU39B]|jgi:Flagellar motor protein|uniref:MotB family protein n=1 Tax=Aeromonas sp. RU39B TaxID=1907416 RepID=UPI0009553A9D|nr:MotB family protein [Aeromonas sp. RU39B]SIR45315.1 chemotaxis protein MotB [Aeromonas sp. RU39B]